MSNSLPESLLEMHFHSALIQHYVDTYKAKFLKLYKPVPQKEAWVGFDQGWTRSDLTEAELFEELKGTIQSSGTVINKFYLGEFLQFKVVEVMRRRSKNMPQVFTTPYYRSELSLKPNKSTRISQHETLLRLHNVRNAIVLYACCMVFSQEELWEIPDLNKLRFVDIASAPSGWTTNEAHYILFKTMTDPNPLWCSEPTEGRSYGIDDLFEQKHYPQKLTGQFATELIKNVANVAMAPIRDIGGGLSPKRSNITKYLPECFTLVEFENNE